MILESVIARVVELQKYNISKRNLGFTRELIPATRSLSTHALIISGVRRCGKSTLLLQMMKELDEGTALYLNFDSPQLYGFSIQYFPRLDNVIRHKGATTLFFDEIQQVTGWELYVRQKLNEGFRVIITRSNAASTADELGTKLTGLHITQELFPYSYTEFLSFRSLEPSAESLLSYMHTGGFPEYVKNGDDEQLASLFSDVLIRDIVTRHGIKDIKSLQRLTSYLFSNIGKRVTATSLRQDISLGATSTVLSWFSYLEQSYLLYFMPMYCNSVRAQLINPRKVYAVDPGLANVISNPMAEDQGRKLENLVFLHLRRKYKELYYFDDKGHCDFVAMKRGDAAELVQVCADLSHDDLERKMKGLFQAMRFFKQQEAKIITFDNNDFFEKDGYTIELMPAHEYLNPEIVAVNSIENVTI